MRLAPGAELDCRTTSVARWHGRRPSAVAAVVLHRRDGRSGGASYGLVRDPLVDLIDDLACMRLGNSSVLSSYDRRIRF